VARPVRSRLIRSQSAKTQDQGFGRLSDGKFKAIRIDKADKGHHGRTRAVRRSRLMDGDVHRRGDRIFGVELQGTACRHGKRRGSALFR